MTGRSPDISTAMKEGLQGFLADPVFAVLSTLLLAVSIFLAYLFFVIPGVLLTFPFIYAYYACYLQRARGKEVAIGDVIRRGFGLFHANLSGYVCGILIALGLLFLILPGIYLMVVFFFVPLLVVDQRAGVSEAISRSNELVAGHKLEIFVVLLVFGAVNSISGGLLTLITQPILAFMQVSLYRQMTGEV